MQTEKETTEVQNEMQDSKYFNKIVSSIKKVKQLQIKPENEISKNKVFHNKSKSVTQFQIQLVQQQMKLKFAEGTKISQLCENIFAPSQNEKRNNSQTPSIKQRKQEETKIIQSTQFKSKQAFIFSPNKQYQSKLVTPIKVIPNSNSQQKLQLPLYQPQLSNGMKSQIQSQIQPQSGRFAEIQEVRRENEVLKQRILGLEAYIKQVDEFRLAMEKPVAIEELQTQRLDLLKAQVTKQQRYIRKQTRLLRLAKLFHTELANVLQIFLGCSAKVDSSIKNIDFNNFNAQVQSKYDDGFSPVQMQEKLKMILFQKDEENKEQSAQDLISLDERMKSDFVKNFNQAYDKIVQCERQEHELRFLFNVDRVEAGCNVQKRNSKLSDCELQTKSVLKEFIDRYKNAFNVSTIFQALEISQKDKLETRLVKLIGMTSKIQESFEQLACFGLFNSNCFVLKNESVPAVLWKHQQKFDDFFTDKSKNSLCLNHGKVLQMEQSLQGLLLGLLQINKHVSYDKNFVPIEVMRSLQDSLRDNILLLIHLGVAIGEGSQRELFLVQSAYFDKLQDNQVSHKLHMKKHPLSLSTMPKQNFNECEDQTIDKQQQLQPINSILSQEDYLLLYETEKHNGKSFKGLSGDLMCHIQQLETLIGSSHKAKDIRQTVNAIKDCVARLQRLHCTQELQQTIRDLDLHLQKEYSTLFNMAYLELEDFVQIKTSVVEKFFLKAKDIFQYVNDKFDRVICQYDKQLMEAPSNTTDKHIMTPGKGLVFKNIAQQFRSACQDFIDLLAAQDSHQQPIYKQFNIKSLHEEYTAKFNSIKKKWGLCNIKLQKQQEAH